MIGMDSQVVLDALADAVVAADRTNDVMARILEDLRMLDAEELGLGRHDSPAAAFAASRVG